MEKRNLLKNAFEHGNVPCVINYCFTEPCPMKDECIHYLAGLYKSDDVKQGHAIFPNALKDGKCQFFAQYRIVKMAWGFGKLFARFGYKNVDFDYFTDEIDFTKI